jgi:hypothetical protein
MADFTDYEPYKTLYRFWFRNIISIFVPFFACLYFNVQIVRRLRQQQTGARLFNATTSEHRVRIYQYFDSFGLNMITIED